MTCSLVKLFSRLTYTFLKFIYLHVCMQSICIVVTEANTDILTPAAGGVIALLVTEYEVFANRIAESFDECKKMMVSTITLPFDLCKNMVLTLKVLVATINAQWEGMGDVASVRYKPALLPPFPTLRVSSYITARGPPTPFLSEHSDI